MIWIMYGVAFLLEMVAFVAFAAIGYLLEVRSALQAVIFIVLLALVITFWGIFMAPKSVRKFDVVPYYIAKTCIYGVSAITLFSTKGTTVGVVFVALVLLSEAFLYEHNLEKPNIIEK